MKLSDINEKNGYGRLLIAGLAILTTENFRDKTPDQVLNLLENKANEMYGALEPIGDSPGPFGLLHVGRGTFGEAVNAAKQGHNVARTGWNGSGMFAYIVPANSYPAQTDSAKKYWKDKQVSTRENEDSPIMVPYREYWALKTAQEDVATWAPSGSDSLAEDWCIIQ